MTAIINGELVYNELSKNSKGGTELMAQRMVNTIDNSLLSEFNIIHSRVRPEFMGEKNILILHDLPGDPESAQLADPEFVNQFEKIVFVSNWQLQQYHNMYRIPYSKSVVIENAIEPFEVKEKDFDGTLRLIYHTTPHRGLSILVPAFKWLVDNVDFPVHLDVYSSFGIYGWSERDQPYSDLFKQCEDHDNISYHGSVSNQEVREALERSHMFAYPCIWQETSCLAMIEALCSGNVVVSSNLAALPETCGGWANMYMYHEDLNQHAQRFANVLYSEANREYDRRNTDQSSSLLTQAAFNNARYNWHNKSLVWTNVLQTILRNSM